MRSAKCELPSGHVESRPDEKHQPVPSPFLQPADNLTPSCRGESANLRLSECLELETEKTLHPTVHYRQLDHRTHRKRENCQVRPVPPAHRSVPRYPSAVADHHQR